MEKKTEKRKDIAGQRFGKLVAIEPTEKRKHGYTIWKCQCDCGNITEVLSRNLTNGTAISCGCIREKNNLKDLTGQRFGKLVAIELVDKRKNGHTMWKCQCDCGNITEVRTSSLNMGRTISCGCKKKEKK